MRGTAELKRVRRKNSIVHGGYDMHVKIEVNYVMHW